MKEPIVEENYLKELHILIVEDLTFMRSFIRTCVEINFPGCLCHEANTGAAAIDMLQTRPFSIVLCDWELPIRRGDEILQWIREESLSSGVPFIMVTAHNEAEHILKA